MTRDQWREIEKALRDPEVQFAMEGAGAPVGEQRKMFMRPYQLFKMVWRTKVKEEGMPDEKIQVGRLAMRVEGEKWNAHHAMPNAMEARFGSAPQEWRSSAIRSANRRSWT